MTKREISSLVIKLMGVFILLKILVYIPVMLSFEFGYGYNTKASLMIKTLGVLLSIVSVVIVLAFSMAIIFLSDKIAAWLIKGDKGDKVAFAGSVSKEDVMIVVFSCIGLYLIAIALPMFIADIYAISFSGGAENLYPDNSALKQHTVRLLPNIISMGLGVWFFAGSGGILKLWKKIRH